jgi:acyl-CoA synthetase (NDP forming)
VVNRFSYEKATNTVTNRTRLYTVVTSIGCTVVSLISWTPHNTALTRTGQQTRVSIGCVVVDVVDTLCRTVTGRKEMRPLSSVVPHSLDDIFHPGSVAVVGASTSQSAMGWVERLLSFGYGGCIYPVNPRATEIAGLKAYPTVRDIPGKVDYAIFNIPARLAPRIMEDCAARNVKVAHIYTAGFSETGNKEAKALQERVTTIARAGGVRIIGPNCMGIYNPVAGLTFNPLFSREPGDIAFVSQTGAGSTRFVHLANSKGIHFSKVVSYGNAVDLDAPDFLEYLADDAETAIVTCYIEGVRDGHRFMGAVRKCLAKKPVIILKAGLTESGAGVAASHTSSIAGSRATWEAFFKQTGAIQVDTLEEITDVILALRYMRCPDGRRVGIVGRGGGIGVIAADICENTSLKVPPFRSATRKELAKMIPEAGAGIRNPVETTPGFDGVADFYAKGLSIIDSDPEIDFIMTHMAVDVYGGHQSRMKENLEQAVGVLADTTGTLKKPLVAVLYPGEQLEVVAVVLKARQKLLDAGIPVFPTIEAAASAVSRLISYYNRKDQLQNCT